MLRGTLVVIGAEAFAESRSAYLACTANAGRRRHHPVVVILPRAPLFLMVKNGAQSAGPSHSRRRLPFSWTVGTSFTTTASRQ